MRGRGSLVTRAAASLAKVGINPQNAVLSESFLRLEAVLNTSTSTYRFGILNNENPNGVAPFGTEVRLAQQDSFFVDKIGIYVAKPASASDTAFSLNSYANPNVFTTANTATELGKIYNGRLSYKKDGNVICPAWPIIKHLDVNTTQKSATNGLLDEFHGDKDGLVSLDPNWIIKGNANNIIEINTPGSLSAIEANSRVVLIFHGVLAQNTGFTV